MAETIGKVTLNLDFYSGQDPYGDGDVEEKLLEIVKNHGAEEFPEIIHREGRWPYLFHLSGQRANIVDWYPIKDGAKVLEVGAGCGAITGALLRKAGRVTAHDPSRRRSRINALRNQDAENLEVVVGAFSAVAEQIGQKFDCITLIGAFDAAPEHMREKESYGALLNRANDLLEDGGEILLTAENRLGLKYFAGCVEKHTGRAFEGIEGYPGRAAARTFSRAELEQLLRENGFAEYEFYYPYPDYLFPTVVYSEERLPQKGELMNNLRNFDTHRYVFFDEGKAFDGILESGYFPIFSNSFFVRVMKKG